MKTITARKNKNIFISNIDIFSYCPPPERVERPLELRLLELVFPVEDPGLLQRDGHGTQQQPVLAAREPQPWTGEVGQMYLLELETKDIRRLV